jgi:monofunctional biosynthetic peptidoglycan transglycosylase
VAEDASFFSHRGFAADEIREALDKAVKELDLPRGASTITQQLAKNLWLSPSRNPIRKVKEAVLTWQLERALTKRRILELYLNVVEFGPGVYGAEAAARHYFRKPAAELTEHDAAQLAAALPRPSAWHPGVGTRGYQRYVEDIRRRMERIAIPVRLLQ